MRDIYIKLAVLGALLSGFFLGAPFVFAQSSGDFVFIQQSDASSPQSYFSDYLGGGQAVQSFIYSLGNGFTGTTTGADVAANYIVAGSAPNHPVALDLRAYSDAGYSSYLGDCEFLAPTADGTYPTTGTFVSLSQFSCGSYAVLNPAYYYQVDETFYQASSTITWGTYYGAPNGGMAYVATTTGTGASPIPSYPNFSPQFAIVGDGFQITPTASSSGLFLSGAQSFCNSQFGTSSAGIFGIGTDFANAICQVGGYLFIPTQDSLQGFSQFPALLEQRIPFSYAYGVVNSFNGLSASTTENMESFSISGLGSFASTTAFATVIPNNFDILSTTTISKFYPDPIRESMLFLGSCAIWFVLIMAIYHRVVPHKVGI